jgi:K+ transporter
MTLIRKTLATLLASTKTSLFTTVISASSVASAKDVELMDGVLEKAVIGGAEGLIIGAAAIFYFMVWQPLKRWLSNKKLTHTIQQQQLTELMIAAAEGNDDEVERLLGQGSDVNKAGKSGETALMLAAKNDKRSTVRLLLAKGANPNAVTIKGNTARDIAKKQGNSYVVDILTE